MSNHYTHNKRNDSTVLGQTDSDMQDYAKLFSYYRQTANQLKATSHMQIKVILN